MNKLKRTQEKQITTNSSFQDVSEPNLKPTTITKVLQFSAGTTIHGELICPDDCFFNGKIFGNIRIGNKLVLGEESEVLGNVKANDLIVKGKITGSIHVQNAVNFNNIAIAEGRELAANILEVEKGALINFDQVSMSPGQAPKRTGIEPEKEGHADEDRPAKTASKQEAGAPEPKSDDLFLSNIFQNRKI